MNFVQFLAILKARWKGTLLIFVLTTLQRFVLRDRDAAALKKAERAQKRTARKEASA